MNPIPTDTTIETARKQFEILQRPDAEARLKMAFELGDNLRCTVEAGVRYRHPDWEGESVRRRVVRLMVGERLFREVFGDETKCE